MRPTSSVLRYGAESDPLAAGRELAVAYVVDGRMRRAGDRIRVTIQLLNVLELMGKASHTLGRLGSSLAEALFSKRSWQGGKSNG